ncbi:MAG: hypothetical protein EOQ55_12600 [Mesorhizobium sp.]|nr:MAG: hypothetical protein EOQ55_12600 [Mesorhizobium sp.]RWI96353.1 MAG: hypothetical protein EOR21_09140 [Mesorhizobium sp.]
MRGREALDWSNDSCPVSNEPAKEALPRMGDFAEFICDTCGRFRISLSSLKEIRLHDAPSRQGFLESAKRAAPKGSIPFIKDI